MGHMTSQEALVLRWAELCADPRWHDLAGKIELNGRGVIELTPSNNRHGQRQAAVAHALGLALPEGTGMVLCSVLTSDGIRVPDVAWASAEFMARYGEVTPFPQAPDICVEVRSPSNTDAELAYKTELFLAAGAQEVWIVGDESGWQVFNAQGEQPGSRFGVQLPAS